MAEVHETDSYVSVNVKSIDIQKIEFVIEVLKGVQSKKRSLVSLVVSQRDEISVIMSNLEYIKSHEKYLYAIEGLTSAQQILVKYNKVPDNGLIIYTGIVYADDGKKVIAIELEPLKPIDRAFLTLSYTFYMAPLKYQVGVHIELESDESDLWRQSIRRGKEEAKPVVNPQSFVYFSFLFAVGGIITFQLGVVRLLLQQSPSLFKDHGGVFTITIIVSGSMAVLSSFVLVLSSFLLKNWMKNIHYTILKTIGSFSAILVPFSLGAAVFVPSGDLNWIAYTFLFAIFGGLLYLYSFIWKYACAHQQGERYNSYPMHWAYLLIVLVPLSISLLSFFSSSLTATVFVGYLIMVPLVISFMRLGKLNSAILDTSNKTTIDHP